MEHNKTPDKLYQEILSVSGYSDSELKGSSRKRDIGDKRSVVSCIMSDNSCSLHEIGKVLNRTHGTVWTSYLNNRKYVNDEIERIKKNMNLKN